MDRRGRYLNVCPGRRRIQRQNAAEDGHGSDGLHDAGRRSQRKYVRRKRRCLARRAHNDQSFSIAAKCDRQHRIVQRDRADNAARCEIDDAETSSGRLKSADDVDNGCLIEPHDQVMAIGRNRKGARRGGKWDIGDQSSRDGGNDLHSIRAEIRGKKIAACFIQGEVGNLPAQLHHVAERCRHCQQWCQRQGRHYAYHSNPHDLLRFLRTDHSALRRRSVSSFTHRPGRSAHAPQVRATRPGYSLSVTPRFFCGAVR